MSYISKKTIIEQNVTICEGVQIYGAVTIQTGTIIGPGCIIGFPMPEEQNDIRNISLDSRGYFEHLAFAARAAHTFIGANSHLRSNVIIYAGVSLGCNTDISHFVCVRERSKINQDCHITSGTQIMADVRVGRGCRLAGTLCNRTKIGDGSVMLGHMMHAYSTGLPGSIEESPILGKGVLVGREASVIGHVTIADYGVLGAGAVLTKSIPEGEVWAGTPHL